MMIQAYVNEVMVVLDYYFRYKSYYLIPFKKYELICTSQTNLTPLDDIPSNTRRYLDVDSTFFERYGRQMSVKTTLRAYRDKTQ